VDTLCAKRFCNDVYQLIHTDMSTLSGLHFDATGLVDHSKEMNHQKNYLNFW
jgi:hypothetical protein